MSVIFDLIRERKLNTTEAIILQYYCLNNSFSEPNSIIADELNVSLSVVSRAKRKLIQLGLIEIQKNYTSGLARDADTITTNFNIVELFGLTTNVVEGGQETIIEDKSEIQQTIQEIVKKHLRRSSRPVTLSNIATQISKIDGKMKPKSVENHKGLIIDEIETMGYQWFNNSVFATLL